LGEAAIADGGLELRNWAESRQTRIAAGRAGVGANACRCAQDMRFTAEAEDPAAHRGRLCPNRDRSLFRQPRLAEAVE
jgi:hypothetical protein